MAEEKKYIRYSAVDIEKYHKGLLSSKEMHELEKAALDDPFLADALEGYSTTADAQTDISELEKRLQDRITDTKSISILSSKRSFKWWKLAAAAVFIGVVATLSVLILRKGQNGNQIAEERTKETPHPIVITTPDSNKIAPESTSATAATRLPAILPKTYKKKTSDSSTEANVDDVVTITNPRPQPPIATESEKGKNDSTNAKIMGNALLLNSKLKDGGRVSGFFGNKSNNFVSDSIQMNYFRGKVTDMNNNPLAFANVTSTKYDVGTYADVHGNFTLISADSALDVQIRSVGFENNLANLKSNIASNKIVLEDDKAVADRVISNLAPDTSRARGTLKSEEPEPADGWTNYDTYMANNLNIPDDLKREQTKGQVELSFRVDQNGEPVDIKVEKSLCQKCDQEAIRLIRQGPKWKKKNKKTKRVTVAIPFDAEQ